MSFLIPILLVSRFYLVFSVMLTGVTWFLLRKGSVPKRAAAAAFLCLIPLYVLLTVARSHSIEYLNGIFEMKHRLPIFVSQPYIYIAHNYDNLNCLVRDLPQHAHGIRMLFPVVALSGLKFLFPQLASLPLYLTKEELTTLTFAYDAYYDFGAAGVALLSGLLGAVSFALENRLSGRHHPLEHVFYAQLSVYLGLSFFTTWFSNPATWFLFAVSFFVWLWTVRPVGRKSGMKK